MSVYVTQVGNELVKLSFDIETSRKHSGPPEPVAGLLSDHFSAAQSHTPTQRSGYNIIVS